MEAATGDGQLLKTKGNTMNAITRNIAAPATDRGFAAIGQSASRFVSFIQRAHSRRPRQELWQWVREQVRAQGLDRS